MLRGALVISLTLAAGVFGACNRHEEPNPPAPVVAPSNTAGAVAALQSAAALASSPLNDPPQNPGSLASAIASASAAPSASASAAPSASASTSASASATPPGPLGLRLVGGWVFSRFDLTDPSTAEKWKAIPPAMQSDILQEAPKASIEFTPQQLITRLKGVPDKTTTWTTESETADALIIKTGDEGRKKISFPDAETARIEELDKKGAFVTLFARRKPGAAPAPSASASK